jgi:PAS domain S-box-containing protein
MFPLSRSARVLSLIAALSFAAMVLLYSLPSADVRTRSVIANISFLWSSGFAVLCCALAARRTRDTVRRTWIWIGTGATSFFAGQLVWSYYELVRGINPPYPSLADVGYLGIYVCLILGVTTLVRGQPKRRADPELILDTVLVTFTVGALIYEFFLAPLITVGASRSVIALWTSVGWSIGGIAVLWVVLIQMLRRTVFPLATAALVLPGVVVVAIGNLIYAVVALRGAYHSGAPLDLTWDAGLLMLATAAAVAPERNQPGESGVRSLSGLSARIIALLVGIAGMLGMALVAMLRPAAAPDIAFIVAVGIVIIGARMLYSLGADRRYAELLEEEVANQTRSLMSSLGATASAERSLRLVMESVPDAITVLDREGRVLDANAAGRALVTAPGNVDGHTGLRSAFAWLEGPAARIARENLVAAFEGELRRFEVPYHRGDGTDGTSHVLYAPVRESGRIPKVLALVRDVTEQRRTQTQLQQAEKLAAMGQLVSGVAHEINNPAAIISGFAQTLLLEPLSADQRETIQMMYDEATRIGRITSNLLAFARAGSKERTLIDLNEIVKRTFALRSYHLTTLNITVNLELDPDNPRAWANGSEMQQMLLNLLINAEQALTSMNGRRAITIRTSTTEDRVYLHVLDSGPGIPKDIQERIFDPFFTTKPEGTGTGLGLSICYGIVHDHGGRISVESTEGEGAVFTVELPRDARTRQRLTPQPMPVQDVPAEKTESLSVLLVDDEEGLRRAVVTFLRRRGMYVVAVGEGADALRTLERESFDVIVSDVRMPGMGGGEFLDRLRVEHPTMVNRLIFSTGDTFAQDTSSLLRDSGMPSLVKPYDFAKLEALLREVAESATRTSA